ncbi:MAG: hypothetical protein BRC45_16355 [Cyanobacteria bacterium QS_5_48_63]|nr:MAG: hypothetical protein BRC45_16355 [Cyanobacteria bacterium QS_5_48_63]
MPPTSLTDKGCRRCCAGSSSGEAGSIGCGSSGATGRGQGFRLVPRRWVVERTLAWISRCRRLCQDYEKHPQTSETFIYLAMIQLMLKRLA